MWHVLLVGGVLPSAILTFVRKCETHSKWIKRKSCDISQPQAIYVIITIL